MKLWDHHIVKTHATLPGFHGCTSACVGLSVDCECRVYVAIKRVGIFCLAGGTLRRVPFQLPPPHGDVFESMTGATVSPDGEWLYVRFWWEDRDEIWRARVPEVAGEVPSRVFSNNLLHNRSLGPDGSIQMVSNWEMVFWRGCHLVCGTNSRMRELYNASAVIASEENQHQNSAPVVVRTWAIEPISGLLHYMLTGCEWVHSVDLTTCRVIRKHFKGASMCGGIIPPDGSLLYNAKLEVASGSSAFSRVIGRVCGKDNSCVTGEADVVAGSRPYCGLEIPSDSTGGKLSAWTYPRMNGHLEVRSSIGDVSMFATDIGGRTWFVDAYADADLRWKLLVRTLQPLGPVSAAWLPPVKLLWAEYSRLYAVCVEKSKLLPWVAGDRDEAVIEKIRVMHLTADFADVFLRTGDGDHLIAHSAVLQARSVWFRKRVDFGMSGIAKVVDTTQFSTPVMRAVLQHIYTGCVDDWGESASRLLPAVLQAASHFDLGDLHASVLKLASVKEPSCDDFTLEAWLNHSRSHDEPKLAEAVTKWKECSRPWKSRTGGLFLLR